MERPEKGESFEIAELGKEALSEWYTEREFSDAETKLKSDEKRATPLSKVPAVELEEEVSEEQKKRALIKKKIKELLDIGEKKGLVYAIEKAKRSNNPLLLDLFHDILVRDGGYKKILKK